MRIVGGEFRGRRLAEPKDKSIRPTTDRNRESLFNILSHSWSQKLDNVDVLDLFSGTGALGLEALSRGAQHVTFIEESAAGCALLRANVETLDIADRTRIVRSRAQRAASAYQFSSFDLVFADPPYGKRLGENAVSAFAKRGLLNDGALVVLEERHDCLPDDIEGFAKHDVRRFGETAIGFFVYVVT